MRKNILYKLVRRLKVSGKKIKKLSLKKVLLWINKNLKSHPFIFGILSFVWVTYVIRLFFENTRVMELLKFHLKLIGLIAGSWLALVVMSNALRDKEKLRWYFRKKFVFLMLILLYPFGLILLWSGSQFKKVTKIVFTVLFLVIFIAGNVRQERKYRTVLNMSPFDNVIETVTSKKNKAYLKVAPAEALSKLKLVNMQNKGKVKLAVSEIYSRYSVSIVSIMTKDKEGNQISSGSGFIVSRDGMIVTNSHVVESAYKAEVKVGEKIFSEASLVKNLPDIDIAIIKIDADGLLPLAIGNSDDLIIGQFIVALGNPLGFEHSVSSGIISAIRSSRQMKLIQMTVPISPGSSGGPVFNEYGEVVGIATIASFFMAQNLNFAIPINYLKKVISQE